MNRLNSFDVVREPIPMRSVHDLSHTHKSTWNVDELKPFLNAEVLPGDTHTVSTDAFIRFATLNKPLLDHVYGKIEYFYVRYQDVWKDWDNFIAGHNNFELTADDVAGQREYKVSNRTSASGVAFKLPQLTAGRGGLLPGGLSDHFGITPGIEGFDFHVLHHRAYRKIFFDWYNDENLSDFFYDIGPGTTDLDLDKLLKRNKKKDYFTSCLPSPQKGNSPVVPIVAGEAPLFNSIPVKGEDRTNVFPQGRVNPSDSIPNWKQVQKASSHGGNSFDVGGVYAGSGGFNVVYDTNQSNSFAWGDQPGLEVDLRHLRADLSSASTVSGLNIAELTFAFQVQKALERDNQGGTRQAEYLRSHWNVVSDDLTLTRAEFLGVVDFEINCHVIPQTSSTDSAVSPQANLASFATASANGGFTRTFKQHGVIIALCSVFGHLSYQQGLPRKFSRNSRFDFYLPVFGHLREMAVLRKEIYVTGNAKNDELVFGYQRHWREYTSAQCEITGLFRSGNALSLDVWHVAEEFANAPVLSEEFIRYNTPADRIESVPSQPDLFGYFKIFHKVVRSIPRDTAPGDIDHF